MSCNCLQVLDFNRCRTKLRAMQCFALIRLLLLACAGIITATHCTKQVGDRNRGEVSEHPDPVVIRFSGYEWVVKASQGQVGPGPNNFGPEGVRIDKEGNLHLA